MATKFTQLLWDDYPRSLRDPGVRRRREDLLSEPHVKPLNDHVRSLKRHQPGVPWFDPFDGGILARALFVLESPGPEASESGFISCNNPDQTAHNTILARCRAGLCRRELLAWNIVPWYLASDRPGHRFRAPRPSERLDGARELYRILALCDRLFIVVLQGEHAQAAWPEVCRMSRRARALKRINSPHPSGQGLAHPGAPEQLRAAFQRVKLALQN